MSIKHVLKLKGIEYFLCLY